MKILNNITTQNATFFPLTNSADRNEAKTPLKSHRLNLNKNLMTYSDAKTKSQGVGLYLPHNNLILIDFDSNDELEKERIRNIVLKIVRDKGMRCLVAHTGKGTHLYFKLPEKLKGEKLNKAWLLTLGLVADIKTNPYAVIELDKNNFPQDGLRLDSEFDYDFDELDDLPAIFTPVSSAVNSAKEQKYTFQQGSQNDDTISHLGYLYNSQFMEIKKEDAISIFEEYINEYIMFPKWSDLREFKNKAESVWRNFKPSDFKNKSLEYMAEKVKGDTSWYNYEGDLFMRLDDGSYSPEKDEHHKFLLTKFNITKEQKRKEILNNIRLTTDKARMATLSIKTPTQTLIYDEEKCEYVPSEKEEFNIHSLKYDYDRNAPIDKPLEKFLDTISEGDNDIRREILQSLAVGLLPRASRKLFILQGTGSNGKSMLMNKVLPNIFTYPRVAISNESLDIIAGNDFGAAGLRNKLINVSDELETGILPGSSIIKSIVAGEIVNTSGKGVDRKAQENFATLYVNANYTLMSRDKSDALKDRLKFLPFKHKFQVLSPMRAEQKEKELTSDSAGKYLVSLLIRELEYLSMGGEPICSKDSQALFTEFLKEHDYASVWLDKYSEDQCYFLNKTSQEIYDEYLTNADEEDVSTLTYHKFLMKFRNKYTNLESRPVKRQGKSVRVWKERKER